MSTQPGVIKTAVIVGFAIFAMLFGAGNIIFPPYIGVVAGESWFLGFVAYFVADIGLAIMAILALLTSNTIDRFESIFTRLGPITSRVFTGGIMLSVCYLAGPRTCTVSYELGVVPVAGENLPLWVYSIAYFVVAWLFCVRESKMIDYIGKYLTPALVIGLIGLIIVGFVSPLGPTDTPPKIDNVWYMGLMSGYQTMDCAAAVICGYIVAQDLTNKGYATVQAKIRAIVYASGIVGLLMFIVYGGLCYIGATASTIYDVDVQHGRLVVSIFQSLLGYGGSVFLGLVVALACLSTGTALAGASATFLVKVSNNRLKYNVVVTLICFSFALIANIGLSNILTIAVPVILVLFPSFLTMVILGLFDGKIKNANIYKISVGFVFTYSFLEVMKNYGVEFANVIEVLPLQEHGFGWFFPAVFGAGLGFFIKPRVEDNLQ